MTTTMRRSAEITIPLPASAAMELFTPEGERRWAAGWAPSYPAPERGVEPGLVFTTNHGGHAAVWVIVDRTEERICYARVTDGGTTGETAGTVAVDVIASGGSVTRVRVTYDLTALTPDGAERLTAMSNRFAAEIGEWSAHINCALSGRFR